MVTDQAKGIGGWLLVYLVGSIPVTLFYAAGLAGRFFDYHPGAVAVIFLVLAAPLVLVVLRAPSAPAWNIAALWLGGRIDLADSAGGRTHCGWGKAQRGHGNHGDHRLRVDRLDRRMDPVLS